MDRAEVTRRLERLKSHLTLLLERYGEAGRRHPAFSALKERIAHLEQRLCDKTV